MQRHRRILSAHFAHFCSVFVQTHIRARVKGFNGKRCASAQSAQRSERRGERAKAPNTGLPNDFAGRHGAGFRAYLLGNPVVSGCQARGGHW